MENNKINPKTGEVFINTQQMFNKWGKISRSKRCKDAIINRLPNNFPLIPLNISVNAYKFSKHPDWKGLPDFIGYERVASQKFEYMSFKDSRSFVHKLGLKKYQDWADYVGKRICLICTNSLKNTLKNGYDGVIG